MRSLVEVFLSAFETSHGRACGGPLHWERCSPLFTHFHRRGYFFFFSSAFPGGFTCMILHEVPMFTRQMAGATGPCQEPHEPSRATGGDRRSAGGEPLARSAATAAAGFLRGGRGSWWTWLANEERLISVRRAGFEFGTDVCRRLAVPNLARSFFGVRVPTRIC